MLVFLGRIFSFGGYNPDIDLDDEDLENDDFWPESKPLFKELWELNIFSKRWHKTAMKGNIPEQLASHTAVSHPLEPGTMIVYGGMQVVVCWLTVKGGGKKTRIFKKRKWLWRENRLS